MKVVLIGADGQLGSDLVKVFQQEDLISLIFPAFDLTRPEEAEKQIFALNPDIVINTAAFNKVDECEQKVQQAFELNGFAVRNLARWCRDSGAVLVHFSTDYVFDGKNTDPYTENDCPHPLSVYGLSKLCGEYFVLNSSRDNLLIRTCGLYGEAGCWGKGYNFVDTMVELAEKKRSIKVVNDQWITPTYTRELAEKVKELIDMKGRGCFHLTNNGACTWYKFAKEIFSLSCHNPELSAVDSASYAAAAKRPPYSVLENKRAAELGLPPMRHWKDALRDYMTQKQYI